MGGVKAGRDERGLEHSQRRVSVVRIERRRDEWQLCQWCMRCAVKRELHGPGGHSTGIKAANPFQADTPETCSSFRTFAHCMSK